MSVYDNNGSNIFGGRSPDRRFGMQRRFSDRREGECCDRGSQFKIDQRVSEVLAAQTKPIRCNPDSAGNCDFGGLAGGSPALAMVYCPRQYWRALYSPAEALEHGTLFSELHKPFMAR